jgi:lipopolysaccharide transport system permease protein
MPDWQGLTLYSIGAGVFSWLGYFWFQKTRKGFADVL